MNRLPLWPVAATAAAFGLPWMHRLMFDNMLLAIPDLSHDAAHGFVFGISFLIIMGVALTRSI